MFVVHSDPKTKQNVRSGKADDDDDGGGQFVIAQQMEPPPPHVIQDLTTFPQGIICAKKPTCVL